jgi:hypothetical protein
VIIGGATFIESIKGDPALHHLFGELPAGITGTFKRYARKVEFHIGGFHVATLTRRGVLARVTRREDGRKWYSYGDPDGFPPLEYRDHCAALDALRTATDWRGNELDYRFDVRKPAESVAP